MKLPITVDFETEEILPRPDYPPKPVSVSIWEPGKRPEFWAWGHPNGNNCTKAEAQRRLRDVWRSPRGVLFHESKFDLDVAETHLGLPFPPWHLVFDTIFDLFLADPNATALNLKDAAELYLGWSQDDQKPLKDWILKHVPGAKKAPTKWGRHMAKLPGELAAIRAEGDVKRTRALFEAFHTGGEAYDRERRAMPVLLAMERRGVPVNVARLRAQNVVGARCMNRIDAWIRQRLKDPNLEIQKAAQLADAIEAIDDPPIIDEWLMTLPTERNPEGVRKTGWEALAETCHDPLLVGALRYRGQLKTQLDTFVRPWLRQGSPRVYFSYNQVRSVGALRGKQMGARTGRVSSSPNLLNVPNEIATVTASERRHRRALAHGRSAVLVPIRGLALLDPRGCVEAPRGYRLGDLDYSQQELRILADAMPDGPLAAGYRANPKMDAHAWVQNWVHQNLGVLYPRRRIKNTDFGVIYGEGIPLLARKLQIPQTDARQVRNACKLALGAGALMKTFQAQGYVDTVGGRHCPVEPPSVVQGKHRTWDYKLINTYVQGSGGDQIKEAMIAVEELQVVEMLLTIYDEILFEAPTRNAKALLKPVGKAMEEAMPLSVPMIVSGSVGRTWRDCA